VIKMDRRKAVVIAGTATASLAMATGAFAANMGLLNSAGADVGKLDATNVADLESQTTSTTEPPPDVTIIVQDIPVAGSGSTAPVATPAPAPPAPAPQQPAAPSVGSNNGPQGGDDHGADEYEDEDEDEDEDDDEDEEEDEDDEEEEDLELVDDRPAFTPVGIAYEEVVRAY
jgi:hypothetical protein